MQTVDLARFVVETPDDAVPLEALQRARDAVIDTIGCAIAGTAEQPARIARRYVQSINAAPDTVVWGSALRTAPADAAFVNAISGHALDFDDSLPSLRGHPSVPLCAAGLAAAPQEMSGRSFLAAFVLGLEVAGKLGRALGHGHYMRGWHITATVGTFSAACMTGRLMSLDEGQLCNALGVAAAETAGLVRNFGTMAKSFQAGHAARSGYMASWLAREGFTGDDDILDRPGGLIAAYGDEHSTLDVPPFANPWEIFEPGIYVKRWPCCYGNHRGLAGVFELVGKHGIEAADITEINVGFLPDADKALIHRNPQTGLEAKFSIEYCAAAAVIDGRVTLDSFAEQAVHRPQVRALMEKVRRVPMPGQGSFSGVVGYTDVEIVTRSGRFSTRIDHTPGSPEAPMTASDRRDKFLGCTQGILGADRAERLLSALESLIEAPDLQQIVELTMPAQEGGAA